MPSLRELVLDELPSSKMIGILTRIQSKGLRYLEVNKGSQRYTPCGTKLLGFLTNPVKSTLLRTTSSALPTEEATATVCYENSSSRLVIHTGSNAEDQDRGFSLSFQELTWAEVVDCLSTLHSCIDLPIRPRLEHRSEVGPVRISKLTAISELDCLRPFVVGGS